MSVRVMTQVWDLDLPDSEKIVLLALADSANDEGHCWPSMASLVRKCSKSDRTIQAAVRSLVEAKHLTRREVLGKGCNYTVHPRRDFAPEEISPPKTLPLTPEAASDKPSRTVIIEEREVRARAILSSPQWKAFKAMRRQIKKPVNDTAEERLLAKLLALDDAGYPPGDVLDQSTEHCWQGVFKIEEPEDGRTNGHRHGAQRMAGPGPSTTLTMLRAANEAIARDGEDYRRAGAAIPAAELGG
jgi:hypothetical protein